MGVQMFAKMYETLNGVNALVVSWEITDAVKEAGLAAYARNEQDELARDLRAAGWEIKSEGWNPTFTRVSVVAEMPRERDAKAVLMANGGNGYPGKLPVGTKLRLNDGRVVEVERSNGFVMSFNGGAIDLRNDSAVILLRHLPANSILLQ